MYSERATLPVTSRKDPDGIKLYTISASGDAVDVAAYWDRLGSIKSQKNVAWATTPAFAIMHDGASMRYLVVGWWGNDNELFTSVSVLENGNWVEDASRFSFCLWDLEVIWYERNSFVRHIYKHAPDLTAYRNDLRMPDHIAH